MTTSFRDVSARYDRLYPPASLRELGGRVRYPGVVPGDLPQGPLSLAAIAGRVLPPDAIGTEVLQYNTWLMRARYSVGEIIGQVIGGLPRFAACMGLGAVDLVAAVLRRIDLSGLCDTLFPPIVSVCGVALNPLNDACKIAAAAVGASADLAAMLIDQIGDDLDVIVDLLDVPLGVIADAIGELLPALGGLPFALEVGPEKPQLPERASEIGAAVGGYDVVCLDEVWNAPWRERVLAGRAPAYTGDTEADIHLGSGLLVFSPSRRSSSDGGFHRYVRSGVSRPTPGGCDFGGLVDVDRLAHKGVQLVRFDLGVGLLEVYATHLYSGGDTLLGKTIGSIAGLASDQEMLAVRDAQIRELAGFVAATHDRGNVALILGDFNVAADSAEYATLTGVLASVGGSVFDDWFARPMFAGILPSGAGLPDPGHTNRHGEDDDANDSFDSICAVHPQGPPPGAGVDDYYCDDRVAHSGPQIGSRIDYIFVERPTAAHRYDLQVSRIRRRPFRRAGARSEPQFFLSDHLGLEISLYARRH